MPLLGLPPETLVQIMDHVGSSFFREDLGRLTVCRQWFGYALPACFKDLKLSRKNLQQLLASGDIEEKLLLFKDSSERLDLELKGFEDWNSIARPQGNQQRTTALNASSWDGEVGSAMLTAWTTDLDNDLARLADASRSFRKLRTIRIQALSERHPLLPHLPRRDFLSFSTVRALLSVERLMVLDLDLCGTVLVPPQESRDDSHICPSIGALLNTLKCLRLRMRNICTDVLKPKQHDVSLRLYEVIINLSLSNESPMITSASYPTKCGSTGIEFPELKTEIAEQAEALAAQMASPKTLRILTHTLPLLEMRSLDILTGKSMILADEAEWEDDGKTVEEDLDSESEISDDSSFHVL